MHVEQDHQDEFFETEDIEGDPPAGQFVCVARCRLSGALLGPPNHHQYAEALQRHYEENYRHLTMDAYRRQIETVRDPEVIEQWKAQVRKRRVYRLKSDPERPAMEWAEARAVLVEQVGKMLRASGRAVLPAPVAQALRDPRLTPLLREAWARESRFPMTLMIALRPALRHMGLYLFKTDEHTTFVSTIPPSPIDPAHAIAPIREALEYLRAHPGCSREQMVADLRPGGEADDPAVTEILGHLHWLIDKGHVIEFFNGHLAVPQGRKPRRPPPSDRHRKHRPRHR
jgi:hypothetical protein